MVLCNAHSAHVIQVRKRLIGQFLCTKTPAIRAKSLLTEIDIEKDKLKWV